MGSNTTVCLRRRRVIEDQRARKLGPYLQRSHIHSCRRFAAFWSACPAQPASHRFPSQWVNPPPWARRVRALLDNLSRP